MSYREKTPFIADGARSRPIGTEVVLRSPLDGYADAKPRIF